MFCRKCGSELLDDSQFCAVCGTKVEIKQNAEVKSTTGEESSIAGLNENKSTKNKKDQGKKKESPVPIIIGVVCGLVLIVTALFALDRIDRAQSKEKDILIEVGSVFARLNDVNESNDESAKQDFVAIVESGYAPGMFATKSEKSLFNELYERYEKECWGQSVTDSNVTESTDVQNEQKESHDSQQLISNEALEEQTEDNALEEKEESVAEPEINNEWAFPGELYEGGIPEETYQIIKGTYYGEAWVCTLEILSPTDIRYTDGESSLLKVFKTELGESGELLLYIGEGKKPDGRILSVYYIPDSDKTGISIYDGGRGDYNQSHVTRSLGRITTEVGEKRPWQDEYDEYFGGCRLIEEGGNYFLCRLHSKAGIKISDDAVVGVAKEIFTNWNEEECYEEVQYYYSYVPFYENVDQLFETGHWLSNDYSDLGWDSDNLSFEVKEYQLMNCPLVKYNEDGEINLIIDYYAP